MCYKNLAELLHKHERNSELSIHQSEDNSMKLNNEQMSFTYIWS